MDIKRIIREELNDLDWIKDVSPDCINLVIDTLKNTEYALVKDYHDDDDDYTIVDKGYNGWYMKFPENSTCEYIITEAKREWNEAAKLLGKDDSTTLEYLQIYNIIRDTLEEFV